jgi:hypothetical protein
VGIDPKITGKAIVLWKLINNRYISSILALQYIDGLLSSILKGRSPIDCFLIVSRINDTAGLHMALLTVRKNTKAA